MKIPSIKPGLQTLVRVLWVWWTMCAVLLLGLWVAALINNKRYLLKSSEAAVYPRVQELAERFQQVQDGQSAVLSPALYWFREGQLSEAQLRSLRSSAGRRYLVHYLDERGQPLQRAAGQPALAPSRLAKVKSVSWLAGENNLFNLRSLRFEKESYFITGVRNGQNQFLLVEMALPYVFGPWLRHQFADLRLDSSVSYQVVPYYYYADPALAPRDTWQFLMPTLFPNDANNFDKLLIRVDNGPALAAALRRYLAILAAGVVIFISFAAALFLAGLSVGREMELAQARANFTAMVSHELKTPIAAIAMYAEILEQRLIDDPAKIAEYHRIIGAEADRLKRLIANLLDLGRIEQGAKSYTLQPEDLNCLVEAAVQHGTAPFTDDRPNVVLQMDPALPPVFADREATIQAIANLIHNGCKYSGAAREIEVRTRVAGDGLAVDIMDRGPGIPESQRVAIFQPFVRLEQEDRRTSQGTGLGLALVKRYIEGQGGTVQVQERPGGGSIFTLTFQQVPKGEPNV